MKSFILYQFFCLLAFSAIAGPVTGIYLSAEDFENGKLSYTDNKPGGHVRLHLHDLFWPSATFTITSNNKTYAFRKNRVFGFREDKKVYRFYRNETYCLVEKRDICIYTQSRNITHTKGFTVINDYYFSTSSISDIMPLNFYNLTYSYKDSLDLLARLEHFFPNRDVAAYDNVHKMYKVNYVFQEAKNNAQNIKSVL